MEEAALDHGLDLLPIFIGLFLFPLFASATSFGPISVEQQATNAEYIVRGQILGASWVEEERQSRKPYTHWKLKILEQLKGDPLGEETIIRQPGGELGGMGYHVAGSANFGPGEEVVVNIRSTEISEIKEVLALASGKYTVEKTPQGDFLRSGLGFLLVDPKGNSLTLKEYSDLVKRVVDGRSTDEDKNVFVNKSLTHSHPEVQTNSSPPLKIAAKKTPSKLTENPAPQDAISHQESPPPAEKKEGSLWIFFTIAGGVFLLLALLIALKRMI